MTAFNRERYVAEASSTTELEVSKVWPRSFDGLGNVAPRLKGVMERDGRAHS